MLTGDAKACDDVSDKVSKDVMDATAVFDGLSANTEYSVSVQIVSVDDLVSSCDNASTITKTTNQQKPPARKYAECPTSQ